jgi:TRAP-type C4-dicarboxylate transport system substrate-binding protein
MTAARWAAALGLMLAVAGCGSGADKAGGGGGVTTLQLGTPDAVGRISSRQAERFAAEVRKRSGGRLRIKVVHEANKKAVGDKPAWDQTLASLVRGGKLDLAIVPARAWDRLGVTSLQALQAPFLITTMELAETVAKSPAAEPMLRGLGKGGVVGLALLPEELRHPVGFGHAMRGLGDFAGRELRVPLSNASYALMRALGARPVDLSGEMFTGAVASREVTGTESSLGLSAGLPAPATISANVTFYPKVNTLVANRGAFASLSGEQREVVRDAAAATLAAGSFAPDAEAACRQGEHVIEASAADIAALERAALPVYAKLEHDPLTRALIARIRALKARAGAGPAPSECGPPPAADPGPGVAASDDPGRLNGVYRFYLAQDDLVRAGVDPDRAVNEYGVQTVTLRDGAVTASWRSADNQERCDGTYTVAGDRAELVLPRCGVDVRFRWRANGDGLRLSAVESAWPGQSDEDALTERTIWGSRPWKRIADAPAEALPDGVYRAEIGLAELRRAGLNDEQIAQEHGIQTLTVRSGRFTHDTRTVSDGDGVCRGRVAMTADRIRWIVDAGPCGGATSAEVFNARWVRAGDGIRFLDVRSGNLAVRTVFGDRIWKKIG